MQTLICLCFFALTIAFFPCRLQLYQNRLAIHQIQRSMHLPFLNNYTMTEILLHSLSAVRNLRDLSESSSLIAVANKHFSKRRRKDFMPKMAFGLDRFYKHIKSNCSNMLAWNELHIVKGQLGPFTDLEEGEQWRVFCMYASRWLGQS